jgi:hypothetical protein
MKFTKILPATCNAEGQGESMNPFTMSDRTAVRLSVFLLLLAIVITYAKGVSIP